MEKFKNISLLKDASIETLKELEKSAVHFSLPGGQALFVEGEWPQMMYFLSSGSLAAFRTNSQGNMELIGHIRQGEPAGEMALIANEYHTASVYALRDSELLGIPAEAFQTLLQNQPAFTEKLTRTVLFRNRKSKPNASPKVFALLSASPTIDIQIRAKKLKEEIEMLGSRCVIVGEEASEFNSVWFDEVEAKNDVVLLISNLGFGQWPLTCLRQADRIWVFGRLDAIPSSPLLPDSAQVMSNFKLVDMVLVRELGKKPVSSARDWLNASGATRILPWREGEKNDPRSLARVICGKSIGLVLSGGGARALAHVGAVRALRELGIEFDFLGGTSMGGVVAACVALGWSNEEVEQRIFDSFVKSNPLNDYVLPVVAFTSGKKVNERLKANFGGHLIEDLKKPFFCVSTNLQTAQMKIHRTGDLAKALRASIAIPGLLPPIVDDGDVLVDGAVINNFPMDIMAETHRGQNIGVDVSQVHSLKPAEFMEPPNFFKWVFSKGIHSPPPIAELMMRSATLSLNTNAQRKKSDLVILPEVSDIELRDWKSFDKAVERGYFAAIDAINDKKNAEIFQNFGF